MNNLRTAVVVTLVLAATVSLGARAALPAEEASSPTAPSIESLLRESKIPFDQVKDGVFSVKLDMKTNVILREVPIGTTQDGSAVTAVALVGLIMQLPDWAIQNEAVADKLFEINMNTPVGWLTVANHRVYYRSAFWLQTADGSVIRGELAFFDQVRGSIQEMLLAAIEG